MHVQNNTKSIFVLNIVASACPYACIDGALHLYSYIARIRRLAVVSHRQKRPHNWYTQKEQIYGLQALHTKTTPRSFFRVYCLAFGVCRPFADVLRQHKWIEPTRRAFVWCVTHSRVVVLLFSHILDSLSAYAADAAAAAVDWLAGLLSASVLCICFYSQLFACSVLWRLQRDTPWHSILLVSSCSKLYSLFHFFLLKNTHTHTHPPKQGHGTLEYGDRKQKRLFQQYWNCLSAVQFLCAGI